MTKEDNVVRNIPRNSQIKFQKLLFEITIENKSNISLGIPFLSTGKWSTWHLVLVVQL